MVRLFVRYRWFLLVFVLALAVDLVSKEVVFERLGLGHQAVHEAVERGWERYERQQERLAEFEEHVTQAEEAGETATMTPPSEPAGLYFTFEQRHQHELIPDYLYFTGVLNPGAFGGMLGGQTLLLLVLSLLAVLIVGWILFRAAWPRYQITGGLIIGGAFGNIFDRVVFGAVRDFIDFRLPEAGVSWLNPWNTFNFADAAIVGGILALLAIELFFPLDGGKSKRTAPASDDEAKDSPKRQDEENAAVEKAAAEQASDDSSGQSREGEAPAPEGAR